MNELTKEWVDKAENDFDSAYILLRIAEIPIPDSVAFHCQQCAEKYLKAFLQERRVRFKYTHSLILLLDLCLSQDKGFNALRDGLAQLENYSVATRYPGVTISLEIAEEGFEVAGRVRDFMRKKLEIS